MSENALFSVGVAPVPVYGAGDMPPELLNTTRSGELQGPSEKMWRVDRSDPRSIVADLQGSEHVTLAGPYGSGVVSSEHNVRQELLGVVDVGEKFAVVKISPDYLGGKQDDSIASFCLVRFDPSGKSQPATEVLRLIPPDGTMIKVGRNDRPDFDPTMSRNQFRTSIKYGPDGQPAVMIEDMGSLNHTAVYAPNFADYRDARHELAGAWSPRDRKPWTLPPQEAKKMRQPRMRELPPSDRGETPPEGLQDYGIPPGTQARVEMGDEVRDPVCTRYGMRTGFGIDAAAIARLSLTVAGQDSARLLVLDRGEISREALSLYPGGPLLEPSQRFAVVNLKMLELYMDGRINQKGLGESIVVLNSDNGNVVDITPESLRETFQTLLPGVTGLPQGPQPRVRLGLSWGARPTLSIEAGAQNPDPSVLRVTLRTGKERGRASN